MRILAILLFVVAAANTLAAQDKTKPLRGDPASGKALVSANKCLDCHRIGEAGSRLGPDLTDVGERRSSEQIERAIVAPDDEVLPEHRAVRVVTKSGTSVAGKLLNQDAFSVQLMDAAEQLKSYAKSDLRELAIQEKGLMPSYADKFNAQQIADLVRYLASLKGDLQ